MHGRGSYYLKADGKMAQSEWIYDSSYQAWYYLKSDGSYAKMHGKELITLNQTVKWHKVSGFMTLLIKPGIT